VDEVSYGSAQSFISWSTGATEWESDPLPPGLDPDPQQQKAQLLQTSPRRVITTPTVMREKRRIQVLVELESSVSPKMDFVKEAGAPCLWTGY